MAVRNVLWIMCDQLTWLSLAAYRGPHAVATPAIDRLAREGMVLDRCYTPSPVCVPARFASLTGRYPHHTGCTGNATPLPWRFRTAAHHFAAHGRLTGFIGKMHPVDPQTHGFDVLVDFGHYYDYLGPKTSVFARGMGADDAGSGVPWVDTYTGHRSPWRDVPAPEGEAALLDEADHPDSFFAREAARFLHQCAGDPAAPGFFLFVSFLRPHRPFAAPTQLAARHRPQDVRLPTPPADYRLEDVPAPARRRALPGAFTPAGDAAARNWIADYSGNVEHVDACVGQVLDALDEAGLAEDTLVAFMADHGEMLYDHGLVAKFTFFEASSRVPCILRGPGVPAGSQLGEVADLTDLLPTSLDAAGLPPVPGLDGASLWGSCQGDPARRPKGYAVGSLGLDGRRPMYMLRRDRWKYNRYAGGERELYDLEADPGEWRNRADDPEVAAVVRELDAALDAHIGAEAARCQREGIPLPAAERARAGAL